MHILNKIKKAFFLKLLRYRVTSVINLPGSWSRPFCVRVRVAMFRILLRFTSVKLEQGGVIPELWLPSCELWCNTLV